MQDNKQVVEQFTKALSDYFNGGPLEPLMNCFDPRVKMMVPGMPPDAEGFKQVAPAFQSALSNFNAQVSDVVSEGDIVYYRMNWAATHSGSLMGIPATGKTITVTETHFERIKDGKIIEHGGNWDQLGMLQQIGAIPTM